MTATMYIGDAIEVIALWTFVTLGVIAIVLMRWDQVRMRRIKRLHPIHYTDQIRYPNDWMIWLLPLPAYFIIVWWGIEWIITGCLLGCEPRGYQP